MRRKLEPKENVNAHVMNWTAEVRLHSHHIVMTRVMCLVLLQMLLLASLTFSACAVGMCTKDFTAVG